jgi:flagellar protein FlaJ
VRAVAVAAPPAPRPAKTAPMGRARPAAKPPAAPRRRLPWRRTKAEKEEAKLAKAAKPDAKALLVAFLKVHSYRLLGRHLERESPRLGEALDRAGFVLSPGMYRGLQASAALAGLLVFGLLGGAGLAFAMGPAGVAYGVLVGAVAGGSAWAAFPFVVKSRTQNHAHAIDRELPFALSELSVLAGIGLSPIVLIRRMGLRPHDPATTAEFRRIANAVDTEGVDLVTAMAETARKSPSASLRTTLWDMANLIHQGGDLETYLKAQSETVLDEVRASQKTFTDSLGTYADMYITIVLLGVMFLAVGAFMLDAFRTTAGPVSANGLLLLLSFGLVPLIVVALGLILSSAHGSSQ